MVDRRREKLLPIARWPTAEEAQQALWFQPISLGPVTLTSRTWVPAMVPWRATADGFVTDEVLQWYGRFAKGAPGAIVIEATGIRDIPSGPLLRAGHDRFIEGLSRVVETVHRESQGRTKAFIQLIDFLSIKRRPTKEKYFAQHLQVTDAHRERLGASWLNAPEHELRTHLATLDDAVLAGVLSEREFETYRFGLRERITDVALEHIRSLPQVLPTLFADAAARCAKAGFDGVELHFAHAYTMASFLSARNTRTDGYGGNASSRVRLPLEVISAVRSALPPRHALGCRYLADEIIEGGSSAEDSQFFGIELARAGLDFISLSRGGKFEDAKQPKIGHAAYPYTGVSGHECMPTTKLDAPFGRNVQATARIRTAIRAAGFSTPVVACGGIASFWQAEEVLKNHEADIVASARQSLADPDWLEKTRAGRGDEVRRCLFTNYCEGLDQSHKSVTCHLWDRQKGFDDDATVTRSEDGRRLIAPTWER